MNKFLKEFKDRGFFYQCTSEDELSKLLDKKKIKGYIGFDCTAESLHVGSLLQIMCLRLLQKHGHRPIVLLGGGTTRIGDPSGKDKTRAILSENKNKFFIKDLYLNKNLKINSFEKIYFNFLNDKKKKNTIIFKKNKKNYEINGKVFDASILVENLLENNNSDGFSSIFDSLNTDIAVKIDKTFIDQTSHTNNLRGNIKIINNEIIELDLVSNFPNDRKITLKINTNKDNEKITTLFSNYPKPLVNQYKFIKGFEEGVLDFQSVKKGNISKSILNIDNFKVKEVPVLAKLLSLASLQGIADLLTGEGIRFTDFEMKFSNEGKLMKIDEIYAIGPAISIMMSGYIESKKLISLRGTLVPARTINRTIASIPLIGKVLVGKKPEREFLALVLK